MKLVDIGIFAYNEEKSIGLLLEDLAKQSAFLSPDIKLQVSILANGCKDDTVKVCNSLIEQSLPALKASTNVYDLKLGGKSRTWNIFTHQLSRADANALIFLDADIRLANPNLLEQLIKSLDENPNLVAVCSKPIKDIEINPTKLSATEKAIVAAGGSSDNWKKAICGQLYILNTAKARTVYMPVGLPVEDGFLRAMLLTDLLSEEENLSIIDGFDDIWHSYESIRSIPELIAHQTRIIIGSAINSAIFKYLRRQGTSFQNRQEILKSASTDELWLEKVISTSLPRLPHGYVPFHFITKRIKNIFNGRLSGKKLTIGVAGLLFDLLVWLIASYKMARGKGVGYW